MWAFLYDIYSEENHVVFFPLSFWLTSGLFSILSIAGHQCCPGVWHVCCYETWTEETQTARNWQCMFQHCPWSFWPFGLVALFKYPWLQAGLLFLQWCRGTRGCEYSVMQMVTIVYLLLNWIFISFKWHFIKDSSYIDLHKIKK